MSGPGMGNKPRQAQDQETTLDGNLSNGVNTDSLIADVAAKLHDLWREPRRIPEANRKPGDSEFDPRIKDVNGVQYDIANLHYRDLPEKFQYENREAAKGAVSIVLDAMRSKQTLDAAFIERASDTVHQQWLERNASWAPPEQNVPYSQLADAEKEKDRVIVRAAIESIRG